MSTETDTATISPTKSPQQPKRRINLQAFGIYIAAVVLFLILGLLSPQFLTIGNLRDVAVSASVNAIIGLGLTFVIITGGIDLSVGAIASFVGIVSANFMVNGGMAPILALVVGIVVGVGCGAVNGFLITGLKLPPFIATLGTMSVFQGLAYVVTDGKPVYNVPTGICPAAEQLHSPASPRRAPGCCCCPRRRAAASENRIRPETYRRRGQRRKPCGFLRHPRCSAPNWLSMRSPAAWWGLGGLVTWPGSMSSCNRRGVHRSAERDCCGRHRGAQPEWRRGANCLYPGRRTDLGAWMKGSSC